jgi:hypothetical protein
VSVGQEAAAKQHSAIQKIKTLSNCDSSKSEPAIWVSLVSHPWPIHGLVRVRHVIVRHLAELVITWPSYHLPDAQQQHLAAAAGARSST